MTSNRLEKFLSELLEFEGPGAVSDCLDLIFGAFVITKDGVIVGANNEFVRLTEYAASELIGMAAINLVQPHERDALVTRLQRDLVDPYELDLLPKTGKSIIVRVFPRLFFTRNQKYRVTEFVDITSQRAAESALRDSNEKFHSIFEQAAVGIARVAPDGTFLEVNQTLCDIVGYTKSELGTITFQDITHPDDLETDIGLVNEVLAGKRKTYNLEKRYFHKNGATIWISLTVSLVKDSNSEPKYFVAVIEDISYRKRIEDALLLQAKQDPLTGLDNRKTLAERLDAEISRTIRYQRPMSLIMIDIDHFKLINDTHGHQVGDQVLIELAAVFKNMIRVSDAASRYGGEEFLLITPELDCKQALALAERIRQRVESRAINSGNAIVNLTISAGVSGYPEHGEDSDTLIRACDDAMYQAKANGRNQVVLAGRSKRTP